MVQIGHHTFSDPVALTYDANGNMTYDGGNMTFEWDAANRVLAINYLDTGKRTEFAYDGLGRRVKIVEYGPGVTATVQPSGSSYTAFTSALFTLPTGSYTLTFQGLNPSGGNNIALIDSVALNSTLVANGSFESPSVTDYEANPSDTAWSYTADYSGIAHDDGTYTSDNPNAPAGTQVAFVKNNGLLTQIWSASAGTYTLSFQAAQRGSGNDNVQQLRVTLRPSGSAISAKTFLWCGNQICEERDSTGANVTKRFFAEGEQRISSSGSENYYYSRDHLGSIREVTGSNGAVKGRYDYDAWGNQIAAEGKISVDFGYTGHYFHQPSGLNLAMYRAYSPALGRWINRDPIGEEGGINLYAYVSNDPSNLVDILGLCKTLTLDISFTARDQSVIKRAFAMIGALRKNLAKCKCPCITVEPVFDLTPGANGWPNYPGATGRVLFGPTMPGTAGNTTMGNGSIITSSGPASSNVLSHELGHQAGYWNPGSPGPVVHSGNVLGPETNSIHSGDSTNLMWPIDNGQSGVDDIWCHAMQGLAK